MKDDLWDDLIGINKRLYNELWRMTDTSDKGFNKLSSKLIIPHKRNNKNQKVVNRISEQESRFMFTNILNSTDYYYSVETPTEECYIQSGKTLMSASSDLSLYRNENSKLVKVLNMEFKALNPALEHIKKDIEKLLREEVPGCWNHLLKNVNAGTFPSLFGKFKDSILEIQKRNLSQDKETKLISKIKNTKILFSICIMDKKIGIQKLLDISNDEVNNFFDYHIQKEGFNIKDYKDWIIYKEN